MRKQTIKRLLAELGQCRGRPLAIASILFLVEVALLALFFEVAYQVMPESFLLSSDRDDRVHIAVQVLKQRAAGEGDRLNVYSVGGSTLREVFWHEDQILSTRLSDQLGLEIAHYNFGSSLQTLPDSFVILDNLPDKHRFLYVVGINSWRFLRQSKYRRTLPLRSRRVNGLYRSFGDSVTWYENLGLCFFRPWAKSWLSERGGRDLFSALEVKRIRYPHDMAKGDRIPKRIEKLYEKLKPKFKAQMKMGFQTLEEIVNGVERKGGMLVLLEQPSTERIRRYQWELEAMYETRLKSALERWKVPYWSYRIDSVLAEEDYADYGHLNGSGKQKFEAWYLKKIDTFLGEALSSSG